MTVERKRGRKPIRDEGLLNLWLRVQALVARHPDRFCTQAELSRARDAGERPEPNLGAIFRHLARGSITVTTGFEPATWGPNGLQLGKIKTPMNIGTPAVFRNAYAEALRQKQPRWEQILQQFLDLPRRDVIEAELKRLGIKPKRVKRKPHRPNNSSALKSLRRNAH